MQGAGILPYIHAKLYITTGLPNSETCKDIIRFLCSRPLQKDVADKNIGQESFHASKVSYIYMEGITFFNLGKCKVNVDLNPTLNVTK